MNIIKNSRAYYILLCLYFYKQMGYAQLKHIFGAKSFECTKDAMQKLVRAKYVEKIQKQGINSFALTQTGHSICQRYFPSKVFCKPVSSANALDRVNRVNYERFIFHQLRYQLQSKTTVNEVCELRLMLIQTNLFVTTHRRLLYTRRKWDCLRLGRWCLK